MKYVAVLPYIHKPYLDACVETMHPEFKDNVLFIDNREENLGVSRSWNIGIDKMNAIGADWLIIISAAIRFGDAGGLDFIELLKQHPDYYIIHAGSKNIIGGKQQSGGGGKNEIFGWHLTAFHKSVFKNVGRFDENFYPGYFEDLDFSVRVQKYYKGALGWDTFPVDVHDTIMGHSIKLAGLKPNSKKNIAYFVDKWGRHPGAYQLGEYAVPFNNPEYDIRFWPKVNEKDWRGR